MIADKPRYLDPFDAFLVRRKLISPVMSTYHLKEMNGETPAAAEQPSEPKPDAATTAIVQQQKEIDDKKAEQAKEIAKAIEENKKLQAEVEKINDNLDKSRKAVEKQAKQVETITSLYKSEKNAESKSKLMSAKDAAEKKLKDLKSHIELGENLVK